MPRDRRATFAALAAFCLGLYGLAGLTASPARAEGDGLKTKLEALAVGSLKGLQVLETPIEASTEKFAERDGDKVSLAKFRGKAVLLNFWAVWCAPCKKEMPSIDALAGHLKETNPDDAAVVILSIDQNDAAAKKYLADQGFENLRFHHDADHEVAVSMGVRGLPTTLLIDREGRIVAQLQGGAEWDSPEAKAVMAALIEG